MGALESLIAQLQFIIIDVHLSQARQIEKAESNTSAFEYPTEMCCTCSISTKASFRIDLVSWKKENFSLVNFLNKLKSSKVAI